MDMPLGWENTLNQPVVGLVDFFALLRLSCAKKTARKGKREKKKKIKKKKEKGKAGKDERPTTTTDHSEH
jgi:hypothetical protein